MMWDVACFWFLQLGLHKVQSGGDGADSLLLRWLIFHNVMEQGMAQEEAMVAFGLCCCMRETERKRYVKRSCVDFQHVCEGGGGLNA